MHGRDARFFDGVVCDLDGVVYRGQEPVAGAAQAIERLRRRGTRVLFCTNNSTPTVEDCRSALRRVGVDAAADDILTSAVVAGETLARRGRRGARALVVGEAGLRESIAAAGLALDDGDERSGDVVVVGLDRGFTYAAMRRALQWLRAGAEFVATNTDATFPAPGGVVWPGAGAIVASLIECSGRHPEVMGKPHAPMMDAAERRLAGAQRVAIVGDRPETDLAGGAAKGWTTVLVLTGVTSRAEAAKARPRPDVVLDGLGALEP